MQAELTTDIAQAAELTIDTAQAAELTSDIRPESKVITLFEGYGCAV